MKGLIFALLALPAVACASLDQFIAKNFGGRTVIELETCERLVNVSWKNSATIWILTRKDCSIQPTQYVFKEKSQFEILQGKVIIKEK